MDDIFSIDKTYIANTYARFPVEIVSGKGSLAWSPEGKRYIDMGSGIGVTAFGYADDAWQQAVIAQLGKVQHTSNLYYTEPCALLARELCLRSGMKKVFFGNSGAEANECAIKAARKYAAEKKGPEYHTIVTLVNSFHGRTLTTLAATGQEHYHELFQPLTPGFAYAEAEDIEGLKKLALETKAAAVMLECIQGEGGVRSLSEGFLRAVGEFCRAEDVLLIVDEVQTGNGRTGKLYAYMNFGLQPDIVSTAKGLGGGLPLGACLLGEKVQDVFAPGDHGSTFGGNPVCCAGALSVIRRLDEAFLAEVRRKGELVRGALLGAPGVEAVSGLGLMVGVKTAMSAAEAVKACMEKGVLFLTAKDRVRMLPALNIPDELLLEAVGVLKEVCSEG
ncbi:MAG: acetylornithine/succinylornithine family transaminase [Oscillospiraceae bacterium]|nr:acetylornithine/succinylornithine family transaminase [Oscillospiraceae bacterium]